MNEATQRHEVILRIVRAAEIHSHEEILAELRKRGHRITQPTLSRDLRALGLAKSPSGYVVPSDLAGRLAPVVPLSPARTREDNFEQLVHEFTVSADRSGTLVVVRTPPAGAPPVARAIDEAALPGVIGCISGDDTVFVAMRSAAAAMTLIRRIRSIIEPSRSKRRRA